LEYSALGPAPKLMLSARGILTTSPTGFLANFLDCPEFAVHARRRLPRVKDSKTHRVSVPTQSPLLSGVAAAESFEASSSLDHFCPFLLVVVRQTFGLAARPYGFCPRLSVRSVLWILSEFIVCRKSDQSIMLRILAPSRIGTVQSDSCLC
jgi:hypothetical protein